MRLHLFLAALTLFSSPLVSADGGLPSSTEYQVKVGDSFESIAIKKFGNVLVAEEIRKMNPYDHKTGLKVGSVIYLPDNRVNSPRSIQKNSESLPAPMPVQPAVSGEPLFGTLTVPGHRSGLAQINKNGAFITASAPIEVKK